MIEIIFSILVSLVVIAWFLYNRGEFKKNLAIMKAAQQDVINTTVEKDKAIAFMESIADRMSSYIQTLEDAINTQLVARSSEVGSPPPSGAYHTLFKPTGDGKVLMIYICLDTGHVARWHFSSANALEEEGKRLIRAAQDLREGSLPDVPMMCNIPIGNSGTIH